MVRAGLLRVVAAGASALVLVTSCGSGPSANEWARNVCDALKPWRTQIAELNAAAQRQMSTATSAAQSRDNLVELLAGAETVSATTRTAVAAAGTPDVDGGDDVARRFVASLEQTRDAYARARGDLQGLPTDDDNAFYDGVVVVMARLNDEYVRSGVDTTQLNSPELREAFDGIEQCR